VATHRKLKRAFIDAGFFIARFNQGDQLHSQAKVLGEKLIEVEEMWTTDAVLLEVAASLAKPATRAIVVELWNQFHGGDARCRSVEASAENLIAAMELYRTRSDKAWSLTDCLSFVVMEREGLREAITADRHFEHAGFSPLLLD
jgi:predicted nucleic acid-binding protein